MPIRYSAQGAETCMLLIQGSLRIVGGKTLTAKTTKQTSVLQDCYYSSSERPNNKKMYKATP